VFVVRKLTKIWCSCDVIQVYVKSIQCFVVYLGFIYCLCYNFTKKSWKQNFLTCHSWDQLKSPIFSWFLCHLYCCDRKSRAAYAQSFALWQQATIEFTCHDHFPRTLVVTCNRSQVNIGKASTPRSLFYCLFAPHIWCCSSRSSRSWPNHTINATSLERLQQYHPLTCAVIFILSWNMGLIGGM